MGTTLIPFGPQHPVLPEPIQLQLTLDEEKVVGVVPKLGYVHRGIEKAAQLNDFQQNVFLVERICGICSIIHALAYCGAIERIMGVTVSPRARYLRTFWSELHRLQSHLLWLGLLADSMGFEALFMQTWRLREEVVDLMEYTAGHRIIPSVCVVGGVRRDLSAEQVERLKHDLPGIRSRLENLTRIILKDYTVQARLVGKGVLTGEQVLNLGAAGPVLRASGIAQDTRTSGYAAYGELEVVPVTAQAGDSYARLEVRVGEMFQAFDLMGRILDRLPEGPVLEKIKGNPKGEAYTRVEQPRGELMYYILADGTRNLERMHLRTPTFANIPPLLAMLPGCELADVPVITLSVDPCISCTER